MEVSTQFLEQENSRTLQRPSLVFLLQLQWRELEYISTYPVHQGQAASWLWRGGGVGGKGIFFLPLLSLKILSLKVLCYPSDRTSVYEWAGDTMFGWFLYLVMVIFGCFLVPFSHVCMYMHYFYTCGDTYVCMCAYLCEQALGGQGLMLGIILNCSSILSIRAASLSQIQGSPVLLLSPAILL